MSFSVDAHNSLMFFPLVFGIFCRRKGITQAGSELG